MQDPNKLNPVYVDALLAKLTDQRNAALNENVMLDASNKLLVSQLQQMKELVDAYKAENETLKADKAEKQLPPNPEV